MPHTELLLKHLLKYTAKLKSAQMPEVKSNSRGNSLPRGKKMCVLETKCAKGWLLHSYIQVWVDIFKVLAHFKIGRCSLVVAVKSVVTLVV